MNTLFQKFPSPFLQSKQQQQQHHHHQQQQQQLLLLLLLLLLPPLLLLLLLLLLQQQQQQTTETIPECVLSEEQTLGKNPEYLDNGVPLCPTEELPGYEYPVSENPLTLPPQPSTTVETLPDCIPVEEKDSGKNPFYIEMGVPICPQEYVDYDPSDIPTDQAEPPPDCVPEEEKDEAHNRVHLDNGIPICPSEELPGYEYPEPDVPFTLPPKSTTNPTSPQPTTTEKMDYDDYDPNDIPEDQSAPLPDCVPSEDQLTVANQRFILAGVPLCPSEEPKGYEYPEPEIPFTLPPKQTPVPTTKPPPKPECVNEEEKDVGPNPQLLLEGIPICPSDDIPGYNPSTAG